MLKNRFLLLYLLVVAITLVFFLSKAIGNEKPTIVVVIKDLDTQYFQLLKAGAEKGFQDFGVNGKVIAPSVDSEEVLQKYMLHNTLEQNPDALIVAPLNSNVIPILKEFQKKSIPVLLVDSDESWENKTSYIGTNNFELGRVGGMLLASQLQPGDRVAIIAGNMSHPISADRVNGAKKSLEDIGIGIAVEKIGLPNETNVVKEVTETILYNHPDVKGVLAVTDIMALGAFESLKEQGLHMPVIGADGINDMIELVEEGELPGTVAQNPYDMGYLSVEAAMKVINGEKVESNIDSGVDIIIKGNAQQRLDFQKKLLD
ncbi:sugar ABC transporter substrate-binding protein [Halalkalibacter alkaliphilus]|uniref:Sugar ABC transporter substrate-binding protein n=1 Tax=Halalkalibacter alkaliphilus TaxID=2917993 RepID=A0A9X2CRN4_9BACI|nr:sugar ABC transporter substrate-binding protein [Halalkalibacter alkaliphilus]MCL7746639.1 sugar ABC transporter substrate-binding protein [Halalkalibacter alkaliphilus]